MTQRKPETKKNPCEETENGNPNADHVDEAIQFLRENFGDHPYYAKNSRPEAPQRNNSKKKSSNKSRKALKDCDVNKRMTHRSKVPTVPERQNLLQNIAEQVMDQNDNVYMLQKEIGFVDTLGRFYFYEEEGNTFKDSNDNLYILDEGKDGFFDKRGHYYEFNDANLKNENCLFENTDKALALDIRLLMEHWLSPEFHNIKSPDHDEIFSIAQIRNRKFILVQSYFDENSDSTGLCHQTKVPSKNGKRRKTNMIQQDEESKLNEDDIDDFSKLLMKIETDGYNEEFDSFFKSLDDSKTTPSSNNSEKTPSSKSKEQ